MRRVIGDAFLQSTSLMTPHIGDGLLTRVSNNPHIGDMSCKPTSPITSHRRHGLLTSVSYDELKKTKKNKKEGTYTHVLSILYITNSHVLSTVYITNAVTVMSVH